MIYNIILKFSNIFLLKLYMFPYLHYNIICSLELIGKFYPPNLSHNIYLRFLKLLNIFKNYWIYAI